MQPITVYGIETAGHRSGTCWALHCMQPITVYGIETTYTGSPRSRAPLHVAYYRYSPPLWGVIVRWTVTGTGEAGG